MDMMDTALGSLGLASSSGMAQYSMRIAKKAMDAEVQSAANLLDMLPQETRAPQPGDTPAVMKGSFFDTYA